MNEVQTGESVLCESVKELNNKTFIIKKINYWKCTQSYPICITWTISYSDASYIIYCIPYVIHRNTSILSLGICIHLECILFNSLNISYIRPERKNTHSSSRKNATPLHLKRDFFFFLIKQTKFCKHVWIINNMLERKTFSWN